MRDIKSRQQQTRRRQFTWRLGLFTKRCKKRDIKSRQQQTRRWQFIWRLGLFKACCKTLPTSHRATARLGSIIALFTALLIIVSKS